MRAEQLLFRNAPTTQTNDKEIVLLFCLVHFLIVSASIATGGSEATAPLAEFNEVFDPAGDPQNAFIGKPVARYRRELL